MDVNETIRVVASDGQKFRLRYRDDGVVRFAIEGAEAKIVEHYGRGKDDDCITGFEVTK